jgi:hypothetical protein
MGVHMRQLFCFTTLSYCGAAANLRATGRTAGYRSVREPGDETLFGPPVLTGNLASLCGDLEGILIEQGLYAEEAHAMVETRRDSW